MGVNNNSSYRIAPKHLNNSIENPSFSSSITSTKGLHNYLLFWKKDSQSHIISTTEQRNYQAKKLYKLCLRYSKWPLLFFLILGLIGIILYFSLNSNNEQNYTNQSSFIYNKNKSINNIANNNNYITDELINDSGIKFFYDTNNELENTDKDIEQTTNDREVETTIVNGHAVSYSFIDENTGLTQTSGAPNTIPEIDITTENMTDIENNFEYKTTTIRSIVEIIKSTLNPIKGTLHMFGFTSGHQNNFGVPIEEDERILALINNNTKQYLSTTDSSIYRTRVSPTLPIIQKYEITTPQMRKYNGSDDESCRSTSLPLCRGILHYDLTTPLNMGMNLSETDYQHFQHLVESQCSLRVAQFVCAALEPECRPMTIGSLEPCKRICKSVLEPCAHIIASSEILTSTFDCDSYPNSDDSAVCEDPTKRASCYGNEFRCGDKSCIPIQWKCDNIKDCSDGEDEENCKFCAHDEFKCPTNDKCIPDKWRCDYYDDCPDAADEYDCDDYDDDRKLFNENSTPRKYPLIHEQLPSKPSDRPYLTISGEDRVYSLENRKFGTEYRDENLSNDGDPILLVGSKNIEIIQKLNETENSTHLNEVKIMNKEQNHNINNNNITNPSLIHFQDSKEIMMTSDSESKFKYSSTDRTGMTTAHASPCPENELRCISGLCITVSQLCDKVTDCPDGADEAMCTYEN